jgi:hypothetical protein
MIVISMLFKSESLQITFINLDLADCDFCICNDELWVNYHHRTWVICIDANSQISEQIFKFWTLEVKSTFESKYDINEVLCVFCMYQQRFFSFLRKYFYTFVLQIFINCIHVYIICNVWTSDKYEKTFQVHIFM